MQGPQISETEARARFLDWFAKWRPDAAKALRDLNPALLSPSSPAPGSLSGLGDDDDGHDDDQGHYTGELSGLGDLSDDLTSFVDTFSDAASTVMKNITEAKTLQLQLERMRQGRAPLPTAQAQRFAVTSPQAGVNAPAGFSISKPVLFAAAVLGGLGLWLSLRQAHRRR